MCMYVLDYISIHVFVCIYVAGVYRYRNRYRGMCAYV